MKVCKGLLRWSPIWILASLAISSSVQVSAQQSLFSAQPQAVPAVTLYHFLFHYVVHLKANRPGIEVVQNGYLTDLFIRQLNMSQTEELAVANEAESCEAETKQIDVQAAVLLQNKPSTVSKDDASKVLAKLAILQFQKNQTIQRHLASLQSTLGQEAFMRLNTNLHTRFDQKIHTGVAPEFSPIISSTSR